MKKVIFVLSMLAAAITAKSQDEQYVQAMTDAVTVMATAQGAGEITTVRNTFEMIARAYPEQWFPSYYVALCDLNIVYSRPMVEDMDARLEDARKYLETLDSRKDADKSEVNTLWGYYYMAVIAADPATNGQKYFSKPTEYFGKAIAADPSNPRPLILRAFYAAQLPEFIRPSVDMEGDTNKAGELFQKESPGIEKPFWGYYFYENMNGWLRPVMKME